MKGQWKNANNIYLYNMIKEETLSLLGRTTIHSFSDLKYLSEQFPNLTSEGLGKLMGYSQSKGISIRVVGDLLKQELSRPTNSFRIFEGIDY